MHSQKYGSKIVYRVAAEKIELKNLKSDNY